MVSSVSVATEQALEEFSPLAAVGAAGTGPAHPGKRTERDMVCVAHVHDEKVMLDPARAPVPPGAAGVSTAVTTGAGPGAWKVGMGCPSAATTWTRGTPDRAHGALAVSRNTMAPASVEDEPPNLVKSTDAETDDAVHDVVRGATAVVAVVVGVADGEPPEQEESSPIEAVATIPTAVHRLMPASPPTEAESVPGRWPDSGTTPPGWPGRAGAAA